MKTTKKTTGRFQVGDWVSFLYGPKQVIAQVVEARGPLGMKGRQVYRVRIARDAEEPDVFEMPEDELQAAPPADKGAIIKYLREGGLVQILRANLGGGQDPPRVWLTYTPRGGLAHTFSAERGVLGGATVPFFALHEVKVFTGKQEEVIGLLTSFGLSRADAEGILAAVGTAP